MARTISIGRQDFEKLRVRNNFYVDKTRFIKEWWEADDEVTLIARPRRFGKTLNLSTLEKFFSTDYAGRSELFEGLSIWEDKKYQALQGTYPGCQFTSWDFVDFCKAQGVVQSMSKAGCPYDNAPMERFYKTFKEELVHRRRFMNANELDEAVARYVFVWYNHVRPHSYNNWLTPFEARNR